MFDELMAMPCEQRRQLLEELTPEEARHVYAAAYRVAGTAYAVWRDDPVGFCDQVLGARLWSIPRRFLSALVTHKQVAVPSCFGSSKSFSTAQATLWFSLVHPVGTAKVVTIAPLWRQVAQQLWQEIRGAHSRANLPGKIDMAQYKLPNRAGLDVLVAYGIAASPWNEAAVQGIHAPTLLLIVEEAGGIAHTIGNNLRGLLVGDGARMLAIGNPPTDEVGTWFERLCENPDTLTIPIPAHATPNFTGEEFGECGSCPGGGHSPAKHMVDPKWVEDTIRVHGPDSNYVRAKVYAKFPKGSSNAVIPAEWVEAALQQEEPGDGVRLCDLGVEGETAEWRVHPGAWVRLGVDVAADGGDELAIGRCVGDLITVEHTSSGPELSNAVDVAGIVLTQIRRAEALRAALGTRPRVRVKIDAIGVGWGVASLLQRWGEEGVHDAEIVPVDVSERPGREPDEATLRPENKRAEMWLAGRSLLQPDAAGRTAVRLRVDALTAGQLSAPRMSTNSRGNTVIERKADMKRRGVRSPDRAEGGVLLPVYEPATANQVRLLV